MLTGDLLAGPQPRAVLERLLELGPHTIWVRGNADREVAAAADGGRGPDVEPEPDTYPEVAGWVARQLTAAQRALLAGLPRSVSLEVAGFGSVLFCHATPRDDAEVVLVDSPPDRWARALADVPPTVSTVVCGHTHMPFTRLVHGRLVVNPGSVGLPYGRPGAHWALLDAHGVQLRRTDYDRNAARRQIIATSGYPEVERWCADFVTSTPTDTEAVAAFAPRTGRSGFSPAAG